MKHDRVRGLRRALAAVAMLSGLWSGIVAASGGVVMHVFGLAITSRNPRNPLWLALICGLLAWALPMPDRRRAVTRAWRRFADLALSPHEGTGGMRWAAPGTMVALAAVAAEVYFWAGARP